MKTLLVYAAWLTAVIFWLHPKVHGQSSPYDAFSNTSTSSSEPIVYTPPSFEERQFIDAVKSTLPTIEAGLLSSDALYGVVKWKQSAQGPMNISYSGDRGSRTALKSLMSQLPVSRLPKDQSYRIEWNTAVVHDDKLDGVVLNDFAKDPDSTTFFFTAKVLDRCTDRFKAASYKRDRWTNGVHLAAEAARLRLSNTLVIPVTGVDACK